MNKFALLLLFAAPLAAAQLTQVPPRPTCTPILRNGSCADLWRNYNQALAQRTREQIQLYVDRQKELASEQATAPLQQQIDDLTRLTSDQQGQITELEEQIKTLQDQMQADSTAAIQAQIAAQRKGLELGAGGLILLVGITWGIRKLVQNFTLTRKPATS